MLGCISPDAPPVARKDVPVVLLSHGFGGVARQLTWVATPLVQAGFIVVGVDHPGSNGAEPMTDPGVYAPWARVDDLRAALDAVSDHPVLRPMADTRDVSVVGFSLGGWTAALLAGAQPDFDGLSAFCSGPSRDAICEPQREFDLDFTRQVAILANPEWAALRHVPGASYREPRVGRVVLLAPALGMALEEDSLKGVSIPVRIIAGTADAVTPFETNARAIANLVPDATVDELPGIGHYEFLSLCTDEGRDVAPGYCTDTGDAGREDVHDQVRRLLLEYLPRGV